MNYNESFGYIFVTDMHYESFQYDVVVSESYHLGEITQNNGHYAIQSIHSTLSVPIKSPYATSC